VVMMTFLVPWKKVIAIGSIDDPGMKPGFPAETLIKENGEGKLTRRGTWRRAAPGSGPWEGQAATRQRTDGTLVPVADTPASSGSHLR
jgi:hypothetical protein